MTHHCDLEARGLSSFPSGGWIGSKVVLSRAGIEPRTSRACEEAAGCDKHYAIASRLSKKLVFSPLFRKDCFEEKYFEESPTVTNIRAAYAWLPSPTSSRGSRYYSFRLASAVASSLGVETSPVGPALTPVAVEMLSNGTADVYAFDPSASLQRVQVSTLSSLHGVLQSTY